MLQKFISSKQDFYKFLLFNMDFYKKTSNTLITKKLIFNMSLFEEER